MTITIRKALPEDALKLTTIHDACWQSAYSGIIPHEYLMDRISRQEQRVINIKNFLADPNCGMYCVEINNKIIGRLAFAKCEDSDKQKAGEIGSIYLLEEFWNKGYGKEMLDFALTNLRNMEFNEIILWVLEENTRARKFYEKHGFVLDGANRELNYGRTLNSLRYIHI